MLLTEDVFFLKKPAHGLTHVASDRYPVNASRSVT